MEVLLYVFSFLRRTPTPREKTARVTSMLRGVSRRQSPFVGCDFQSRERVVEGLDRLSSGPRVENEASSFTLVFDLDPEFIAQISGPIEVNDDSAALPVSEVIST